jgi:hypothetical protein
MSIAATGICTTPQYGDGCQRNGPTGWRKTARHCSQGATSGLLDRRDGIYGAGISRRSALRVDVFHRKAGLPPLHPEAGEIHRFKACQRTQLNLEG